ncbi:MAG: iron ABC transporter permease [Pseudomonadota bacterium]
MRLSWWGHLTIWLLFAAIVYFPLGQLVFDAFYLDGTLNIAPLADSIFTFSQWKLLGASLLLAMGTSTIAVLIGVPFAFLCEKTDLPGRGFFSIAYLVPLLIPPYMHAIVWGRLLAQNGPVNVFLMDLFGFTTAPLDVHSLPGAMFVLAFAYFPFVTLLTLSGLKSLDRNYEEAALQQQGYWQTLVKVTLPMVRPQIAAAALFVFVFSIIDFAVPDILRVQVYPVEIFIQFSALYNEQAAILLGVPLLAVTVLAIAIQARTMRGKNYVSFTGGRSGILQYSIGRMRFLAVLYCLLVLGFAVLIPVYELIDMAGAWQTYTKAMISSSGQIGTSFLLAILAAAIMTLFSLFVATSIQQTRGPWRTLLEYLSQIPFAVPSILLGIGLIKLWNRPVTDWLYGSSLIVILGYVAHYIPFTVRAVYSSLQQMNPRFIEAGRLARDSGFWVTGKIILPLIGKGLLTAFFIAFILTMGELGVTLLVIPPGTATVPIKIYNFMHYGAEATVAALCLILITLQLMFAISLFGLGRLLVARH